MPASIKTMAAPNIKTAIIMIKRNNHFIKILLWIGLFIINKSARLFSVDLANVPAIANPIFQRLYRSLPLRLNVDHFDERLPVPVLRQSDAGIGTLQGLLLGQKGIH